MIATEADAAVLGLNLVSDGRNVIMAAAATDLAHDLELRGYVPIPVAMPELLKGGGGIKCCTLELRRTPDPCSPPPRTPPTGPLSRRSR